MESMRLFLLILHLVCASVSGGGYQFDPDYLVPPKCRACDVKSCPQLTFCAGVVVKDQCGCCQRCSSDLFQPHVQAYKPPPPEMPTASPPTTTAPSLVDVCEKRQCPKFKICVVNQQGLPICTCPSEFICGRRRSRRNKRNKEEPVEICGTDGVTYPSRCHLKIANCNSEKRIKQKHEGVCTAEDIPEVKRGKDKEEGKPPVKQIIKKLDKNYGEVKLDKEKRKQLREERRKERKQRRKEKQRRRKKNKLREKNKRRARSRRMKRRNEGNNMFPSNYDVLIGRHTKWSSSQVRKSKI